MNLARCLDPLTAEQRERIKVMVRTLPTHVHAPWRTENPAELKVRLANEQRIRTRRRTLRA